MLRNDEEVEGLKGEAEEKSSSDVNDRTIRTTSPTKRRSGSKEKAGHRAKRRKSDQGSAARDLGGAALDHDPANRMAAAATAAAARPPVTDEIATARAAELASLGNFGYLHPGRLSAYNIDRHRQIPLTMTNQDINQSLLEAQYRSRLLGMSSGLSSAANQRSLLAAPPSMPFSTLQGFDALLQRRISSAMPYAPYGSNANFSHLLSSQAPASIYNSSLFGRSGVALADRFPDTFLRQQTFPASLHAAQGLGMLGGAASIFPVSDYGGPDEYVRHYPGTIPPLPSLGQLSAHQRGILNPAVSSPISLPTVLAQPEDVLKLSQHQCLLRYQIEAFEATDDDCSTHTRGRNKPIEIGQVGIRCRHCAHLPVSRRQKGSIYFPASLLGLYQAAQNMSTTHMQCGLCTDMPADIKQQFVQLLATKGGSSGAGRPYWAKSAKKLGLVDTDRGIRFLHNIPPGAKILDGNSEGTSQGVSE